MEINAQNTNAASVMPDSELIKKIVNIFSSKNYEIDNIFAEMIYYDLARLKLYDLEKKDQDCVKSFSEKIELLNFLEKSIDEINLNDPIGNKIKISNQETKHFLVEFLRKNIPLEIVDKINNNNHLFVILSRYRSEELFDRNTLKVNANNSNINNWQTFFKEFLECSQTIYRQRRDSKADKGEKAFNCLYTLLLLKVFHCIDIKDPSIDFMNQSIYGKGKDVVIEYSLIFDCMSIVSQNLPDHHDPHEKYKYINDAIKSYLKAVKRAYPILDKKIIPE